DLDRYDPFRKVTANDVTLDTAAGYLKAEGRLTSWLRYDAGWRHDEIRFDNRDRMAPENSLRRWSGVDSPKATLSVAREGSALPQFAFSVGQAFFTNDPRISGTPLSRA